MLFTNEFLFLIFFNSSRREFHNLTPSNVRIIFFKFLETKGREKHSDEDCLVIYQFESPSEHVSGPLLISSIILVVSSMQSLSKLNTCKRLKWVDCEPYSVQNLSPL